MAENRPSPPQQAWRVKDVRGRKVTQLDPVTMHLLRQHDVIEADVLRAIAHEPGVRITAKKRAALFAGLLTSSLVIGLFSSAVYTGNLVGAPLAKTASLIWICSIPWIIWYSVKRARFGKIATAMLKYLRCPHCGYDLRMLPTDPADGTTICPECGCAWRLETQRKVDEQTAGVSRVASSDELQNGEAL